MVFGSIISSPRWNLSLQQVLDLANIYLENASKSADPDIVLVLCHDTEVSLSQVKKGIKHKEDREMREGIGSLYIGLGDLLASKGHRVEAQAFYKKSEKWGGRAHESNRPRYSSRPSSVVSSIKSVLLHPPSSADTTIDKPSPRSPAVSPIKQGMDTATISTNIFPTNVRPPTVAFNPPEPDARLNDTPQLACCLALLQSSYNLDDILDPTARTWFHTTKNDPDEQERLKTLATDVIRAFKRDEFKDAKSVTEVVSLAPVLENDDFRYLLKEFYSGIDQSGLLDIHQLEGLANLVQSANHSGYMDADDLVKVLELLSTRLRDTHQQSTHHIHQLTMAVSHVLDAMADANVKGLDREKIHAPLSLYLDELKKSSDPYLVYQAAYAYQALLCVPDNESLWQATLRRGGKVMQGVSGLVSAVKGIDLNGFIRGLEDIQQGLAGAAEMAQLVKSAYEGASSLAQGGQGFFECLREELSFSRKCAWYSALRGADTLIREGQLSEFKKLICEAPCRRDAAFQWGVCQRLGFIAGDSKWDLEIRQSAIAFLGEIYLDDITWSDQPNVKQWIVGILTQLSSLYSDIETLLQELGKNGDASKRALYRSCRENSAGFHLSKVVLPAIGSPSLLDRVQERPDVEGNLRQLRRQRLSERGKFVYIPPQAKANLQAHDETRFPLMGKLEEFLSGDQRVFLLLGDSGAGKSTFNRQLECHLWQSYKKGGVIPLHINLPAIDKPEHDMIAKQLRKAEFTEPQIRELKVHRKFTLICDGYDESQQSHNLYTSNRLNQTGEWNAKMVISCRSEYLGVDYRDRFQPGDRNRQSESSLFEEAVITPFSMSQVQDYITQYVSVYRPLWEANEYMKSLGLIPSLNELVKNPFLMSLSLEVLPRMVDPGQDLSATQITRMALYDQFIEHWLERGKKRLGEKNLSPQARSAFESLIDEGFTRNGIDYLKKMSAAIYKEQGGQPIVTYSRYRDENSWKGSFFSREDEKQLLREACPLIRNGNQHRFIHRSLLEYGVALAIFDPHDWREKTATQPTKSHTTSTTTNSDEDDSTEEASAMIEGHDIDSPLAWRSFTNEASTLQFLEERVLQEPLFRQQLLYFIEQSKKDKKWCTAAANAITILVRAGYQFNGADMRGIRVPNADLSYGMFESAQLQGSDLRNVDLRGTWLRKANLDNTEMTGVQFGELPFLKHESSEVLCMYSPDGMTIAAGLENGKIAVYSTSTWEPLWILEGHSDAVLSIAYSPDSNQIASGSRDSTARLWNNRTGDCDHVLNGHYDYVRCVAYSLQGNRVASASDDKTVKLWDVRTGECQNIWIGHTNYFLGVIYSPNGNQIASNSYDCTIRLWDIETERCSHVLRGHEDWVRITAYSPQGDQLASASDDSTVRIWDVTTGECRHILVDHTSFIRSIMYSPNGNQLASSSNDRSIRLWDVDTGKCLHNLQGHNDDVTSVVYSPQGHLIASASYDKTVRLWDAETGVCRQTMTGHSEYVTSVVFSPNGDRVASSSGDGTVRLWNVGAGTSRYISSGHSSIIKEVKYSPRRDHIATCSEDGTARIWEIATGICRQILRGHSGSMNDVAYSPQGDQIASCGADSTVRLWNAETGACIHTLTGHNNAVNIVIFSPQGQKLVSASDDYTVRLWDVRSGECSNILIGHTYSVKGVMYSPSGNQVLSFSDDSTLRIWDVKTEVCNHTLTYQGGWRRSVAYSPQGDQIAFGSDTAVRVWDVGAEEYHRIFIGHNHQVYSVAYSPRGDQIASGSKDGTVKVWDIESRTCLWTLAGHTENVHKILYSSRGDTVISASDDKSVRLWSVASGQCLAALQDFKDYIWDIAWIEAGDINYLAAGCGDGFMGMWQARVTEDHSHATLHWMSTKGELDVKDANIQGVQGLNQLDKQLLKQRGALGEPVHRLREASKKLMTMASVVSKLKTLSHEDPALITSVLVEQPEQPEQPEERDGQAMDVQLRDIVAAFVRDTRGFL